MEQLNSIIQEINLASQANDGVKLAQLEVKLSTYIPTLIEELTHARNNYANAVVSFIDSNADKKMSVAEATIRADQKTACKEDELKVLIESANVILNSIKDQLKIWLSEHNLSQGT